MRTIRLQINESDAFDEVEIVINCPAIDEQLAQIIESIRQTQVVLAGKKDGSIYSLTAHTLYYMESVDNQTFLYDEHDVYETDLKLYELEEKLRDTPFIRISKHLIVNTLVVDHVRALFNGRFEATLTNGEKVIVNRHYAKAFKEKFSK